MVWMYNICVFVKHFITIKYVCLLNYIPLAVETGRYSRPQIPLNERLCKFCNTNSVENEIHFLMLCPLYSDIRYELCQKALEFINNFNMMNVENKFIELMNCDKIQIMLGHALHKWRKIFL